MTPHPVGQTAAIFTTTGEGGYQLQGELTSAWLIGYQGNQHGSLPLTAPLMSQQGADVLI